MQNMRSAAWYSDSIEKIPLQVGLKIKSTDGLINLWCGDFSHMMVELPKILNEKSIIYTDPPWSQNVINQFYASLDTTPPSLSELLERFFISVIPSMYQSIYIEMGKSMAMNINERLRRYDHFDIITIFNTTYGSTPYAIIRGGWNLGKNKLKGLAQKVYVNQWEMIMELMAMEKKKGATCVVDPFCGVELFGECAINSGMRYFGCEIQPRKLAKGVEKWVRAGKVFEVSDENDDVKYKIFLDNGTISTKEIQ